MADAATGATSEFQRTLLKQIAVYEGDLERLRHDDAAPEEISTFERIVAELHRLQLEDLAELALCMVHRPAVRT